jgi:23S rRNA pseudouridine2604 synthase
MATTLKLKKPAGPGAPKRTDPRTAPRTTPRPPVRGAGSGAKKARPTLAQAQAERAQREAQFQRDERAPRPSRPPHPHPHPRPAEAPPPRRARPLIEPVQRSTAFDRRPPERPPARAPERRAPPAFTRAPRHEEETNAEHAPGSMRLSKRMSELGLASRREADEWIEKGWVRVDGRVVAELGSRVLPEQRITVDAKATNQQAQRVTVLLNKPVGYVSGQAEDGYEPALVLITPANQWRDDTSGVHFQREHLRSLVPAGRLDIDSVGLLVLTQDGRVAKQLIGETSEVEKEYLVRVEPASAGVERLSEQGLAQLRHGLELDGEALRPAQVEWVNDDQLRFVLTQGKKRQIRRMCEAVGLKVLGLKRVRIGRVMLGDLPAGQWRYLRAGESFA